MARKLGLRREDVIEAAKSIADEQGIETLSVAAVAARLEVKPPSVFHHVAGLSGLRRAIALDAAGDLRRALSAAAKGKRGGAALLAVGRAYRSFARRHPGQLAAMLPAPVPGEDRELEEALAAPVHDLARILGELGIEGNDAIDVIRGLRSYLHGFVDLERRGGFGLPRNIEASFERGLATFLAGLRSS